MVRSGFCECEVKKLRSSTCSRQETQFFLLIFTERSIKSTPVFPPGQMVGLLLFRILYFFSRIVPWRQF